MEEKNSYGFSVQLAEKAFVSNSGFALDMVTNYSGVISGGRHVFKKYFFHGTKKIY